MWPLPVRASIWMLWRMMGNDHPARLRKSHPREGGPWPARSWWCLPMRWRTIPLWRVPSTAIGEPECEINVGVTGPGVVYHRLAGGQGAAALTWSRRPSKRPPSGSPVWGSWWRTGGSTPAGRTLRHCRSVLGAHAGQGRQRGTDPGRDRAWMSAAPMAPRRRWPCSTTR